MAFKNPISNLFIPMMKTCWQRCFRMPKNQENNKPDIKPISNQNSVNMIKLADPPPARVIAVESLTRNEARYLKTAAPSILLEGTDLIATDDGQFTWIIPLESHLTDMVCDVLIMMVLETHYDCGSLLETESCRFVDAFCGTKRLLPVTWLVSENSYFIMADSTGFIYGHMCFDKDGNKVIFYDHTCSRSGCDDYRDELEGFAGRLINPVIKESESAAMALLERNIGRDTKEDRGYIISEEDRRKFALDVCNLIRSIIWETKHGTLGLTSHLRFAGNLIGDAVLNQTLQRVSVTDKDFDEACLDPMTVSEGLNQRDVDAVIMLANEYAVSLDRYYFAAERLRQLCVTYTFKDNINRHGKNQVNMVRKAELAIRKLRNMYPDKEEYIWRRLIELEVVSYGKDDRTAHKRPDLFLLLASPITIGTELENKKKQPATDDGMGDMLEPIPLDVKIDDDLPGE